LKRKVNAETEAIEHLVEKETHAWNNKDVETLLSLFHEDMVWPWPIQNEDHDPISWSISQGKFNANRWRTGWDQLFTTYELVHNKRTIAKIELSHERDAAFAVVDIETLWRERKTGKTSHWKGRTCKVYTRTSKGWKMIMHTGPLEYESLTRGRA